MGYSTHQGLAKLKNEHKYVGDPTKIVYRSSWEAFFTKYLDMNDNVVKWGSEEIVIPYYLPTDEKMHRYFPDYFVEFSNGKRIVVEIKPYKETQMPILKENGNKRRFALDVETYVKNIAKWEAAKVFCEKHGMKFLVFTEHELAQLKSKRANQKNK